MNDQNQYVHDTSDIHERIRAGILPVIEHVEALAAGDVCHYFSPVRFGRRRADQFGHLLLTTGWVRFRGAMDVSIAWSEVTHIDRLDHEIVVSLNRSRRQFRFWCNSIGEAEEGVLIGDRLRMAALADPRLNHPADRERSGSASGALT